MESLKEKIFHIFNYCNESQMPRNQELNSHLVKKNQIHFVFYLLNAQGFWNFYNTERNILKTLIEFKIPILNEAFNQFKKYIIDDTNINRLKNNS